MRRRRRPSAWRWRARRSGAPPRSRRRSSTPSTPRTYPGARCRRNPRRRTSRNASADSSRGDRRLRRTSRTTRTPRGSARKTPRRRRLSTSFASVRTSSRVSPPMGSSSTTPTPGRRCRISHRDPRARRHPRVLYSSQTAGAPPPPPPRPSRASATGAKFRPPRETRGSAPSPTKRLVRPVARRAGARRESPPLNSRLRAAGSCTSPRSW
mmetsp:Transcript_12793/g.49959  ORF Transcript_12793/g.49959 Transcript_12793/m.49959 type:complete len:210 (-) Transcript_12793:580-1209(-)